MKKKLSITLLWCMVIGFLFCQVSFALEKQKEDEQLLVKERSLNIQKESPLAWNYDNTAVDITQVQKNISDITTELNSLSDLKTRSSLENTSTWFSQDPNDLQVLKGTTWTFTFTIIDTFSHTLTFGQTIFSDSDAVGLGCYNKYGTHIGYVFYTEIPGIGRGFVASILNYSFNAFYMFTVNGNSATGFYAMEIKSIGTYSDLYYMSGIKVGGGTNPSNCNGLSYASSYENIQWGCRNNDTFYCIDIFDVNWNMIYQAVECGENLHSFSPKNKLRLAPGTYNWKVWSNSGYGEDGFYGTFAVNGGLCNGLSYQSTYENIQWECRGNDTFYCIDIFDANWNILYQAAQCGEGLNSFSPKNNLQLGPGSYNWKVWSYSGYGEDGFYGNFTVGDGCQGLSYQSTYENIQWGCRGGDTFYCIDIFDANWNILHQAVKCGEGLHSFSPKNSLQINYGTYHWKVWSPSVSNYSNYQNGFEGVFFIN